MGPPGVGKTTIAKIMGNIYLQLGFLENDTFITATRSDLVAKYLGQTADKTQKVIDSALGGVLFIDEVYSLGNKEGRDSFAKECIDTINLNMSRIDRPWLLIVGGYKEDIEESFLAYNKGLERRFTVKLEIKGYNEKELFDILKSFINQEGWSLEDNAISDKDIKEHIEKFKYFGGDMRKLFQLAKENYFVRSMKTSLTLDGLHKKLSKVDFQKSIEQFKSKPAENTSHLMMYI
jgi:SpoVK/Ycf46/Vps4 family AAA+-type ATPase